MLALLLAVVALCVALIVTGATMAPPDDAPITTATQTLGIALLVAGIVAVCVAPVLLLMGFFTIQPNQARVLILFGDYKGTVRDEGFHWANPFYSRTAGSTVDVATGKPIAKSTKVSLRARTCLLYTSPTNTPITSLMSRKEANIPELILAEATPPSLSLP